MVSDTHRKIAGSNDNWESEIAAYDEECRLNEEVFRKHSIIINKSGRSELTEEENEVITLVLSGKTCVEIANEHEVEVEVITGLLEVIRAKLSIIEY
ncbi:hypothetical protein ACFL30_03635 [Candidatus Latescibacterota bacterium]